MVGRTLGRYRIIEQLGAGGMGAVYRAHDERLDRDVAIKVLGATAFDDEDARSRFRREALALSGLNHPNIASIHDFETQEGLDLLVMELVPGTTLAERLLGGPLAEKDILQLGSQLMHGLAASHDAGIVHRDLKPGNLRITPDGRLKILDFGLAKQIRPLGSADLTTLVATARGTIVGTLPYMAPEQLRAEKVDERTDVYGAGAVLYEMATGRRPFPEDGGPALVADILDHVPPAPGTLNARISPGLEQVILKMLEKEPDYRYQSAREAAVDLERLALARVQTASGHPAPPRGRPARGRRRPLFFGLSVGTVAVAAVILFLLVSNRPALSFAPRDWIFLASVENATGDPVFERSLDTAFRVSLEQSMHANVFSQSRTAAVLRRMGKEKLETVDLAVGREICAREGIRGLVVPAIAQVGRQYSVAARLIDPATGDTVRSYAERAEGKDDVLPAVDKVAGKLRRDLGESLQAMREASLPLLQATTASLEALKAHTDARFLQAKGDHAGAVRLFERALQLDPDFALAHAAIGTAYLSHIFNDSLRGREHLERAMKLRGRATERERLAIELGYHGSLGHTDEAIRTYQLYLSSWPDDPGERYNFGNVLRDSGRVAEAIEQYTHAIRVEPAFASSHVNLAVSYQLEGRHEEAVASWERAFALEPKWIVNTNLNHEYGFALVASGNPAKAREVFDLAIKDKNLQAAGLRSTAVLDLYEGRYASAEARLREAVVVNRAARVALPEARNHLFLAITLAGRGDRAGAVGELEASFRLRDEKFPQAWLWARLSAMYASYGMLRQAESILAVVRAETSLESVPQRATLHWLEGELELARGHSSAALERITLADKEGHNPFTQDALARAYKAGGDVPRAVAAYEKLVADTKKECLGWEVQVPCVAAKVELAALYRADGQAGKAGQQVDELLTLWRSADAGLPLLERAKALQAQLGKER